MCLSVAYHYVRFSRIVFWSTLKSFCIFLCVMPCPWRGLHSHAPKLLLNTARRCGTKSIKHFCGSPTAYSIGGEMHRGSLRHLQVFIRISNGNFVTISFADLASAKQSVASLRADPSVEYAQLNTVYHVDSRVKVRGQGSAEVRSAKLGFCA